MSARSLSPFRGEPVLDFYNLLIAAFLFSTPWLLGYVREAARLDSWLTAALIAMVALLAIVAYHSLLEWMNVLLGLWLMTSPWILGFTHTRAMHFSIGIGFAVAWMAAIELLVRFHPSDEHLSSS